MDLDNLFVSDLLDTLVGQTDDRSTTQALGEEGDQPEPPSSTQALGEEGEQPEDIWDTGTEPVSTTQALGEEGDQPEDSWDTEIPVDPPVTTQALGEDGDQPENCWDTEPEPAVTTDAVGEDGDQPEPEGSDAPTDQGIWAGEDGNSPGCVVEVGEPEPEPVVEEVDTWWPCDEADPEVPTECEPADESDEPAETIDPALQCW